MGALRIERDGDLLRITLARPETRNAFDAALIAELSEAFVDTGKARAVLLAGDGPSFCAGADVEWMRSSVELDYDANVADATALRRMLEAIDACPAPVVARVQGHALGGGAGLVACSDVAIAEPGAVFGFGEVKLGLVPAVISPFVLQKIGAGAARALFLTGERFDGREAQRLGLVYRAVPEAKLDECVRAAIGELLTAAPLAVGNAKELVRTVAGLTLEEAIPVTSRWIAALRATPEAAEGMAAFLAKRRASWVVDV